MRIIDILGQYKTEVKLANLESSDKEWWTGLTRRFGNHRNVGQR